MNDRAGATPEGGAPDRSPRPTVAGESVVGATEGARLDRSSSGEPALGSPPEPHPAERHPAERPSADASRGEPRSGSEPAAAPARSGELEYEVPFDTGQLQALPTGQLLRVHRPPVDFADDEIAVDTQRRVYSYVGAVVGVIGAVASLFVGWMLPLSIAAIVFGVLGLRREEHARVPAFVGIGTGLVGLVFSAVWIGYYAIVFGALPR